MVNDGNDHGLAAQVGEKSAMVNIQRLSLTTASGITNSVKTTASRVTAIQVSKQQAGDQKIRLEKMGVQTEAPSNAI